MIMIIGSQHDDILYFESVITNKREELVMGKFKVTIGTIFNQAVMLVDQVKTNYLSSALTLYLIEKYFNEMDSYMDTVSQQGYDTGILAERLGIRGASLQCVNQIYRLYTSLIMQLMAQLNGSGNKLGKYQQMFGQGREAFIEKYVDVSGNILSSTADGVTRAADGSAVIDNSQTAIIWALKLSLYNTPEQRDHMHGLIASDFRNTNHAMRNGEPENSLTIGITDLHVLLPHKS